MIALDSLDRVSARAKKLLDANRPAMDAFLRSRDDLEYFRPEFGTIVFPKLMRGSVHGLDKLLREKYETAIVPGSYFDMPEYFRIGVGGDPEIPTKMAFERLAVGLDEMGRS